MDVVVEGVVDKEVTKLVEEVNKKLILDKEADVEVNQEVDKEMAKVVEEVNKELVLDKEADREVNQEVDKEVAPMLSDEFEGPYGHYILEKGLLQGRTPQIGTVHVSVTSPN